MFSNPTSIKRSNLVHEWLFDGNGIDTAGSIDLTPANISWNKAYKGYVKQKATGNGTSSYLSNETSQNIGITNSWTLEYLTDPNADTSLQVIFELRNWNTDLNNYIQIRKEATTGKDVIYVYDSIGTFKKNYLSTNAISSSEPELRAWTWDGTNLKHWVNGVEDTTVTKATDLALTMTNTNRKITVGNNRASAGVNHFNGDMQLFRMYDVALTGSEMLGLTVNANRHHGPSILQQYPELFEECILFTDFRGDSSNLINGVKATVTGATLTTDQLGNTNSAYSFVHSTNDKVSFAHDTSYNLTDEINIEVEFKLTTANAYGGLVYKGIGGTTTRQNYQIDMGADGLTPRFGFYNGYFKLFAMTTGISLNTWYKLSVKHTWGSGANTKFTLNGVDAPGTWTYGTGNESAITNTDNLVIGSFDYTSYNGTIDGIISQVIINGKAFTQDDHKLLHKINESKYIYPFAKYTPNSLPKPLLHIDGTNDGVTWYDQSGNGNNGTETSIDPIRRGQNKGGTYNGTTSRITIGTFGQTNTDFTIKAIFKTSSATTRKIYQTGQRGKGFYVHTDGYLYFFRYYSTSFDQINTGISVADGKVHTVHGVYDGVNLTLYLDGVQVSTIAITATTFDTGIGNTTIGTNGIASGQFWLGDIFDFFEYGSALSAKQIEEDHYSNYIS